MSGQAPQLAPGAGEHPYGGRGPLLMGIAWTGWIIATTLVGLRLYVRLKMEREAGKWALWWAMIALVCATVAICLLSVAVHFGFGNHQDELLFPQLTEAIKYQWATDAIAALSSGFSKLSVVAFLLALQAQTDNKLGAAFLWFLGITNMGWNIVVVFTIMFQCDPPAAAWNFAIRDADCHIRDVNQTLGYIQASWNAVSDIILAVYPSLIVWRLQIPLRLKFVLAVVMGLGVIAGAFSFVKLYQLTQVSKYAADFTHHLASLSAWGITELWSVLIALSIPPIWPLVRPSFEKFSSRITRSFAIRSARSESSKVPDNPMPSKSGTTGAFSTRFKGSKGYDQSLSSDEMPLKDAIEMRTDVSVKPDLESAPSALEAGGVFPAPPHHASR